MSRLRKRNRVELQSTDPLLRNTLEIDEYRFEHEENLCHFTWDGKEPDHLVHKCRKLSSDHITVHKCACGSAKGV